MPLSYLGHHDGYLYTIGMSTTDIVIHVCDKIISTASIFCRTLFRCSVDYPKTSRLRSNNKGHNNLTVPLL
ncbi:hypothetical protein AQUCO_01700731v1 [Aquilegia coerulea]|uniref:Uncharacterized protein n=1 Tax=Aquilegia coerulea TaxID=218851 RepID=A0A2G5DPF9_AQUCA|nr:hypothetical protein AQUCO_01700731v1 [Aquilegia coerulea]